MDFNFKKYQVLKTQEYLKKNKLIFLSYSSNKNSFDWLITEQGLHKLNLNYYKMYNNGTMKLIRTTIFKNFFYVVDTTSFLLKTRHNSNELKLIFNKNKLLQNLQDIQFNVHYLKLNNKMYSIPQLMYLNSLSYINIIQIFYQFLITHLKTCHVIFYQNKNSRTNKIST